MTYGATDDWGYKAAVNKLEMHDLHATILHLMGIDANRFSHPFQGLEQKLTGVERVEPVKDILV